MSSQYSAFIVSSVLPVAGFFATSAIAAKVMTMKQAKLPSSSSSLLADESTNEDPNDMPTDIEISAYDENEDDSIDNDPSVILGPDNACISIERKTHMIGVGIAHPSVESYDNCVYLDYNATTPIFPEVVTAIMPYLTTCFGNPSSSHMYGKACKDGIDKARYHVSSLINASPSSIIFNSCGTESDNRAIDVAIHHYQKRRIDISYNSIPHIVSSNIEHPAVLLYLKHLEKTNRIRLSLVKVNVEGFVNPSSVGDALCFDTALVTIMHSNNEVGTIQPIRSISKVIHAYNRKHKCNILFHSDAAQSLGKINVDVKALGLDMVTIVGHKFGCPKGVAALYIKESISVCPLLVGGGQEHGNRAGTENVALIAGLGEASRLAMIERGELLLHMLYLKLRLIIGLTKKFETSPGLIRFNGPARSNSPVELAKDIKLLRDLLNDSSSSSSSSDKEESEEKQIAHLQDPWNVHQSSRKSIGNIQLEQLPNTVSVSFRNIRSQDLMSLLASKVACSQGSACHSDSNKISVVLVAMHVPQEYATGTLRLSFGRHTTKEEIDRSVLDIVAAVKVCPRSNTPVKSQSSSSSSGSTTPVTPAAAPRSPKSRKTPQTPPPGLAPSSPTK